jgi:hypothetical protein
VAFSHGSSANSMGQPCQQKSRMRMPLNWTASEMLANRNKMVRAFALGPTVSERILSQGRKGR